VGNLHVNFTIVVYSPTNITSLFYPVSKLSYFCICDTPLNCYYFTHQRRSKEEKTNKKLRGEVISCCGRRPIGHNIHGPKSGDRGCCAPLRVEDGAGAPSNTVSPAPNPTSVPSGILIHPTVWPQYTNTLTLQRDRQDNGPVA